MGNLPKRWASTTLENIVTARKGEKPSILQSESTAGFVPYLDIQAIPTQTIADVLAGPTLGGGLRSTVDLFRAYMTSKEKKIDRLIGYARQLGNGAATKRMGFLQNAFLKAAVYEPSQTRLISAEVHVMTEKKTRVKPKKVKRRGNRTFVIEIPDWEGCL